MVNWRNLSSSSRSARGAWIETRQKPKVAGAYLVPEKSKGHLFFYGEFEYYEYIGEVFRAPLGAVMDMLSGNRIGRWECSVEKLPTLKKLLEVECQHF